MICRFIKNILNMCMKFATGKIIFGKLSHLNLAIYAHPYVCLSVCIGVPNHKQPETNMHFNTLLLNTHKAVITLLWISNKHCSLTLLVKTDIGIGY